MLDKVDGGAAFKSKYKARFGRDADVYAVSYYDQTMFIGDAMQKAQSVKSDKVGAQMHQSNYVGVAGAYAYDDKGNRKQAPITVSAFQKGLPVPLASY